MGSDDDHLDRLIFGELANCFVGLGRCAENQSMLDRDIKADRPHRFQLLLFFRRRSGLFIEGLAHGVRLAFQNMGDEQRRVTVTREDAA